MLAQKVNGCSVKHLSCLDVDSMSGVGPDDLESRDGALGEVPVRQKTRFTLATDEERRHPQVFDTFTHWHMRCCVTQGVGNAMGGVALCVR